MEPITQLIDFILHINAHLAELVREHGRWVYGILFVIVFCETGLVVTPFLPGDSLLFAAGALCGVEALNLWVTMAVLLVAAIIGDTVNYWIGYWVGPKVFSRSHTRWLNPKYLEKAHAFTETYGAKAIVLARFAPIVRTFVPFVMGIGRMNYPRFMAYNVVGALAWVLSFTLAGYFFGEIPVVKRNFTLVILGIIIISLLPMVIEWWKHRRSAARMPPPPPSAPPE